MAATELRPLRIGEVLDATFKVYRRNALTLWKIVTLVVVPVNILGALVMISVVPESFIDGTVEIDPNTGAIVRDDLWALLAGALIVGLISAVTLLAATAACLKVVSDTYMGEKSSARSSLAFAGRRLHSLVWVGFLMLFFLALIALVAVLAAVFVGPLVFFFFIPMVWLYISWSFAPAAFLVEGVKGRAALGRSFALVKGRWWPVFWTIVLGTFITAVFTFGIGMIWGLVAPTTGSLESTVLLDSVLQSISAIVTMPFSAALVGIIYFDLRVRKEGFDLQLLAQRISDPATAAGALPPEAGPLR